MPDKFHALFPLINCPTNTAYAFKLYNSLSDLQKNRIDINAHRGACQFLASDKSWIGRSILAKNLFAPKEFLAILSADIHEHVREYVAYNKATPIDTLIVLLKDADESIRYEAAKNIKSRESSGLDFSFRLYD